MTAKKRMASLGRSTSRHNLNKITANKLYKPESIFNAPADYSNKCEECGDACHVNVNICMACAITGPK